MKKILMSVLAISVLAACNNNDDAANPAPEAAGMVGFNTAISGSAQSRAIVESATAFTTGDKVAVVGYKELSAAPASETAFMADEPFVAAAGGKLVLDPTSTTYTGNSNKWPTDYYWNTGYNDYYFYAYYPTTLSRTDATITLPTVPATSEGIADEVLWSKLEGFTYSSTPSGNTMTFKRKLAKVRFRVQFAATIPSETVTTDYKVENISFKALNQAATMDLFSGDLTLAANEVTYTLATEADYQVDDNKTTPVKDATDYAAAAFAPLIYAGTGVELSDLKVKVSGVEFDVTLSTPAQFAVEEGKITYVVLSLTPGGLIEFTDCTIEAWGEVDGGDGSIG